MKTSNADNKVKTYTAIPMVITIISLTVSAILGILALNIIFTDLNYQRNYIKTSGVVINEKVVVSGDDEKVSYKVEYVDENGNVLKNWLYRNDGKYRDIGDKIDFFMNPNDNNEIVTLTSWDASSILLVTAVVFGAAGFRTLVNATRPFRRKRLLELGRPLNITITYCGVTNTTYNKKPSYMIEGEWTDERGKVFVFISPHLTDMPALKVDEEFEVYVDPNNYKKYYFDIKDNLPIYDEDNEKVSVN